MTARGVAPTIPLESIMKKMEQAGLHVATLFSLECTFRILWATLNLPPPPTASNMQPDPLPLGDIPPMPCRVDWSKEIIVIVEDDNGDGDVCAKPARQAITPPPRPLVEVKTEPLVQQVLPPPPAARPPTDALPQLPPPPPSLLKSLHTPLKLHIGEDALKRLATAAKRKRLISVPSSPSPSPSPPPPKRQRKDAIVATAAPAKPGV